MMDDDKQKRPLDPSDFEDDLYDDEFAFDENDPALDPAAEGGSDLADLEADLDTPESGAEFEDTPENWGDFEDPALSAVRPGQTAAPADGGPRKKSFLMKHFNTIVITIGVVLGIGVVGTQVIGPALNAPSSEIAPDGTAEAPPQPFPITPAEQQPPAGEAAAPAADPDKLTPMPEGSAAQALPPLNPGPDLGLDKVGVKEGPAEDGTETAPEATQTAQAENTSPLPPIEKTTEVEKPATELPDPVAFENQPIPTAAPPADPPQMAASEPQSLDSPDSPEETTAPDAAKNDQPGLPEAPVAQAPASAAPSAEPPPALDAAPAKALEEKPAAPFPDAAQTAELAKLDADNKVLSARNKDLEGEISTANAKIDKLSSTLADMEKKIASLEKTASEKKAPEPETKIPPEEPPAKEDASVETKIAPETKAASNNMLVPPAKPTKRPETATAEKATPKTPQIKTSGLEVPRWVLRSAQPGRAVLSDSTTGDLRSIQVGDTLRGVGRIESITQQNGRWVVQGSQSSVRQ